MVSRAASDGHNEQALLSLSNLVEVTVLIYSKLSSAIQFTSADPTPRQLAGVLSLNSQLHNQVLNIAPVELKTKSSRRETFSEQIVVTKPPELPLCADEQSQQNGAASAPQPDRLRCPQIRSIFSYASAIARSMGTAVSSLQML